MSSREIRAKVIDLMFQNVKENENDYLSYMTACVVSWWFRDRAEGMSTTDQMIVCNHVHLYIAALCRDRDLDEHPNLIIAHNLMHELQSLLVEKLKAKGTISVDDDGFSDDEELLKKHEHDFSAWSEELSIGKPEEEGK